MNRIKQNHLKLLGRLIAFEQLQQYEKHSIIYSKEQNPFYLYNLIENICSYRTYRRIVYFEKECNEKYYFLLFDKLNIQYEVSDNIDNKINDLINDYYNAVTYFNFDILNIVHINASSILFGYTNFIYYKEYSEIFETIYQYFIFERFINLEKIEFIIDAIDNTKLLNLLYIILFHHYFNLKHDLKAALNYLNKISYDEKEFLCCYYEILRLFVTSNHKTAIIKLIRMEEYFKNSINANTNCVVAILNLEIIIDSNFEINSKELAINKLLNILNNQQYRLTPNIISNSYYRIAMYYFLSQQYDRSINCFILYLERSNNDVYSIIVSYAIFYLLQFTKILYKHESVNWLFNQYNHRLNNIADKNMKTNLEKLQLFFFKNLNLKTTNNKQYKELIYLAKKINNGLLINIVYLIILKTESSVLIKQYNKQLKVYFTNTNDEGSVP